MGRAPAAGRRAALARRGREKFIQSIIDLSVDSIHTPDIHAILVARRGKLVLDEYFHGQYRDKLHNTRSDAASVTSILFGATGFHPSLPVYEALDAEADNPRKRHEGLASSDDGLRVLLRRQRRQRARPRRHTMQNQQEEPDWYRYALRLPMSDAPGPGAKLSTAARIRTSSAQ